jgi:hypothetical protein
VGSATTVLLLLLGAGERREGEPGRRREEGLLSVRVCVVRLGETLTPVLATPAPAPALPCARAALKEAAQRGAGEGEGEGGTVDAVLDCGSGGSIAGGLRARPDPIPVLAPLA